ncbi:MAG TPA: CBS domain-containing protein [Candidatus Thermoplasmatota archaeon]
MARSRVRSPMKVKDVMTKQVITVSVPNNRRAALKIFIQRPISGIPVVRDDGGLIGIVTRKNIFDHPNEEQLAMVMVRNPITIRDGDTVAAAAQTMRDRQVHRLPVIDKDERLVGIISPIDCLRALQDIKTGETVEGFLADRCVAIPEETPASAAIVILEAGGAKAMPVIDKAGQVVGIVTDRDIYSLVQVERKQVDADIGGNGAGDEAEEEKKWTWVGWRNIAPLYFLGKEVEIPPTPVAEFMVKSPVTVYGKTTLEKAARHMTKGRFNQLPVTWPDGKLRGIVNELDILRYLWE